MYKLLKSNGISYKIEFSVEASLYSENTQKVMALLKDINDVNDVDNIVKGMSDIPNTTLTMLYAGLLEHHSTTSGDGLVRSMNDAKTIAKGYLAEHKEDGWFGLMNELMIQMNEDNFLDLLGVTKMLNAQEEEQKPKKATPQDHKKPSKNQ